MRLFETIKETVTVGQAAEYYGMKIGRNNMSCCPFHNDHHPSMKLNTTYYYCFGCGATGDVIRFGLTEPISMKQPFVKNFSIRIKYSLPTMHFLLQRGGLLMICPFVGKYLKV